MFIGSWFYQNKKIYLGFWNKKATDTTKLKEILDTVLPKNYFPEEAELWDAKSGKWFVKWFNIDNSLPKFEEHFLDWCKALEKEAKK